jgi:Phage integrase, N-terminal SAM-like domain
MSSVDTQLGSGLASSAANTCPSLEEQKAMARRRYQKGSVFLRGKRDPVWIGRWREDVIVNNEVKRIRKSEFLGYKKDFPTMKLALRELEARLAPVNRPNSRPLRTETFSQFSTWWAKNVMTQFKRSSRSAFASQLRVHLVPYFGRLLMKDIEWRGPNQTKTERREEALTSPATQGSWTVAPLGFCHHLCITNCG